MVPRLDDNLQGMLKVFDRMFGEGFWANSIFLFTRWEVDERSEKQRSIKKKKSMDEIIEEFEVILNEKFSIHVEREQFIFIDNMYADPD